MKKALSFILFLTVSTVWAQSIHETEFYDFILPSGDTSSPYQSIKEEFSNIDSFVLSHNKTPKYLIFVMSNKLTNDFDGLNISNYMDYLNDLGAITVTSAKETDGFIVIKFIDHKKENISYTAYLSSNNDILNRFVFFIPRTVGDMYDNEIRGIIKSIKYKRLQW